MLAANKAGLFGRLVYENKALEGKVIVSSGDINPSTKPKLKDADISKEWRQKLMLCFRIFSGGLTRFLILIPRYDHWN